MHIVLKIFVVHLMSYGAAQYDFTSNRPCQKKEDCGRGEFCMGNHSYPTPRCRCSTPEFLHPPLYTPDANGICNKLKDNYCAEVEPLNLCKGKCVNVLGSYYCECGPDSTGRACELRQTDGSVKRASNIAVAFTGVERYLTDRMFMFFVESFGTDFELTLSGHIAKLTYLPEDFILFQSARNECLRVKISKDVCMMVPDRPMYGIQQFFFFDYPYPANSPLTPFPRILLYMITLTLKNNNEIQFSNDYSLPNVVEQRCLPMASMENCGIGMHNMVRKPRGSSLRIKVSIIPSNHCDEPKNVFSEWKLYKVSGIQYHVKMVDPPLDNRVGGTYYDIGAFSYPAGLYRIEIWLTALVTNNTDVQTGTNFAECYFEIVDMPLQAAIEGGISRSVGQGASLTLDASASYDHNTPTRGDFRYLWSCDADIPACREREVADPLFKPALNNFGGEITFTLKVKSSMNGIISMPVSQKITFSDTDIPELSIQCLKNCGLQEYPARVAEAIYLQVIDLKHGLRDFDVIWKGFDENGQEIQGFENMKEEGHYRHQLIVKGNSLSSGKKYTFVAEGGGNPPGRASYQVRMANDIIIGHCGFQPNTGTKMTTRFKVYCYEFGTTVVPNILRYELYNVLPGKYQMDLSLGSFLTGDIMDVLFFSDDIYIKVCDIFENCGKKKLKLEEFKETEMTSELLINYLNGMELLIKQGCINELLIKIAAICMNWDKIEDKEAAAIHVFSAISKIPMNEYRQVEQLSAYIHLVLQSMADAFETYVPADVIATASELLNKITYSLNYKIEIPSYSLYDDYIKDFLIPAKHMVSSIEVIFASRNKLIEKHEEEHPAYAETVYKYRRATKQCIASLELISSSLARGLLQGQKEITLNYKEFSFWVKVDTLLKMTHAVPDENDSHVKFSDELANELSKPMDSFSLSVFKLKNDLFWWKDVDDFDINTEFIVATVKKRKSDGTFSGLVEALDNRLDVYLTMKKTESSLIKGSTTFPPASWDDDKKDKAVTVHRLDIPTLEGQFHIKFVNFGNNLRLALEKNMRPDYDLLMSDEAKVVNASETEFIVPFEANGGYDFFYIGLLPADNTENVSVDYTIEVFDSSCSSWIGDEWRSGICKPGPIKNNMLNCRCKHLSLFGGSLFVAPNKVDPINDIELFLTVADNPYIAIIVLICLLLYFFLFVWAWRKDKKDESYAKLIKLRDNVPGDTNAYVVVAYTGIRIAAGTTSNVGIQIYGSQAESRAHILKGDDVDRKVLQRGSDDWFLLFTPAPLGELERIHLWLDFTGSSPSWYCSKLVIIDVASGDEYVFMMGKWLTILLNNDLLDNEVERIWKRAPTEKTNRRSELAQFNTIYGFREGHAWSAVFNRHPRSPITRIERLSVTLCFLLNSMLLSLMFYGAVYEPNMDFATFTINLADILIAVECMIISFPPSFLIEYCFKKSRVELEEIDESEERKGGGCCGFLRYQIQSFLTFKPLQPVIVSTEIELMKKKQIWFFLGWFLCAFFILIDLYLIVLYSLKFGPKKSLNWLSAVMFGLFQGTFVFEPVQVTLFAVLLAVIFRKQPGVATYKIKELKPEEMISPYYSPAMRNSEEYSPPTIDKRKKLKKTYLPYWEQKWLLFNLIVTFTMLILFGILIYQIDNTDLYYNTQHITEMLTAPKGHTIGFSNVTNHTEFYRYMKGNLLPSLYLKGKLCDKENSQIPYTNDCFNMLVKIPQIRQRRVLRGLCRVPEILKNLTDECQALLNDDTEDKSTYEYSWQKLDRHKLNTDLVSPWKYQDEDLLKRLGTTDTTVPDMKGYTAKLDQTLQKSVDKLTYLMNNNWIDSLTRELFVELILYNVNTHMFCLVRLQVRHPANGIYRTHIEVDSSVIDLVKTNYVALFAIFGICCCILLICWRVLGNIQLYGFCRYAFRVGKIWEFCSAVAGLLYIYYFSQQYLQLFMYSDHTKQSLQNDYISFDIIYLKKVLKFITLYLMGFITMVLIYSFRFGKPFDQIITTIWYSSPRVLFIAKIALFFVTIVEFMFVLSQNPPLFGLSLSIYPFHYRSHFSRGKMLFGSKLLEFSFRLIFYMVHIVSLLYVLTVYIESRYSFVGRKSYNLLYFVYDNFLHKFGRRN